MTIAAIRLRGDQRGFTLIEILVVVVIVAILAAVAALAVGVLGDDREIEIETERLADTIALLQEQAQLEGRDYGLRIEGAGYECLRFEAFEQRWTEVAEDRWLRRRQLPPGLVLELEIEGRRVLLRKAGSLEATTPQVMAYGSGDATPYRLALVRPDAGHRVTLVGSADGTIEIERHELQ
ncbi:MAG: type II secretion system minor pseudopilin GspH [Steroidobacteraceae bacterium]